MSSSIDSEFTSRYFINFKHCKKQFQHSGKEHYWSSLKGICNSIYCSFLDILVLTVDGYFSLTSDERCWDSSVDCPWYPGWVCRFSRSSVATRKFNEITEFNVHKIQKILLLSFNFSWKHKASIGNLEKHCLTLLNKRALFFYDLLLV